MKKKLLLPFIASIMATVLLSSGMVSVAEEDSAGIDVNENPQGDIAYCNFYGDLKGRYASFIDGISLGITNTADPNYYEPVTLDGLDARKQYSGNSVYINLDKEFYQEGDNEFMVNIYYYNFGPDEGKYYFEYTTELGGLNQVTVYKPATRQAPNLVGWRYVSIVMPDCNPGVNYDNGATFRIQNGAFNAWRRVEIVNLSRLKREGRAIEGIAALGHVKIRDLERSQVIKFNDPMFFQENAAKQVNKYDLYDVLNRYTVEKVAVTEADKEVLVTQAELLKAYMDVVDIDYASAPSIVNFALQTDFIADDGLFTADSAPATYYNMITAIEGLVYHKDEAGNAYIINMYNNGFYGDMDIIDVPDDNVLAAYYKTPRPLPYQKVTDNASGRTYYHVNFYGKKLIRGYHTQPDWIGDNRFICTTEAGHLYLYNVDNQTIQYLDYSGGYGAQVGEDGKIYYGGPKDGAMNTLARIDPDDPTLTPKIVYRLPAGVSVGLPTISKNGKWFGGQTSDPSGALGTPVGYRPLAIFYINEDSKPGVADTNYKVIYYPPVDVKLGGMATHDQANPGYDNLFFFCLEGGDSKNQYKYNHANTRVNIANLDTGEIIGVNQGMIKDSMAIELNTHDVWSPDGEYMYYVFWQEVGAGFNGSEGAQMSGGMIRVDKEGRHRQYFVGNGYMSSFNHGNVGGENMNWISGDSFHICALNTDTHQTFGIASYGNLPGMGSGQSYHGHAHLTRKGNILSWGGTHDGILGVNWFDLDELVRNGEVAQGGRYDVNEYVECVSYEGLECDSSRVTKDGRDCQMAKSTGAVYYAINTDIVDSTDDAIKITFDYLDNSQDDIEITYTKGVKEYNELLFRENAKVSVSRKGTKKWKTATVTIDSINCESPGKFYSDLAFRGGAANLYITNVKVEKIETGKKPKEFYNRWDYVERTEK